MSDALDRAMLAGLADRARHLLAAAKPCCGFPVGGPCPDCPDAAAGVVGTLKPWEIPGPNQPNPPLPRDLDPTVPHSEGNSTAGVEELANATSPDAR